MEETQTRSVSAGLGPMRKMVTGTRISNTSPIHKKNYL